MSQSLSVSLYTTHLVRAAARDIEQFTNLATDRATHALHDTWRPEIIPLAFIDPLSPHLNSLPPPGSHVHPQGTSPSPRKPLSATPSSMRLTAVPISADAPQSLGPRIAMSAEDTKPIKRFVVEVLRRSGISVGVLQTALCYLEVVRIRLPDVIRKHREQGASGCFDTEEDTYLGRVSAAIANNGSACGPHDGACPTTSTPRVADDTRQVSYQFTSPVFAAAVATAQCATSEIRQDTALPTLLPQPSPLLCPRRTFLACVILAAKFVEEHSRLNCSWAKLVGLSPREIGRCERAVGNVLKWRLWVGKIPSAAARHGHSPLHSRSDSGVLDFVPYIPQYSLRPTLQPTLHGLDIASPAVFGLPELSRIESEHSRSLHRCARVATMGAKRPALYSTTSSQVRPSVSLEEPAASEVPDACLRAPATHFLGPHVGQAPSPRWSSPSLSYSDSPTSTSSMASGGSNDRTVQPATLPQVLSLWTGGPDAWCTGLSKTNAFNVAGPPAAALPSPGMMVGAGALPLSPNASGSVRLPSFSEGFPFYG